MKRTFLFLPLFLTACVPGTEYLQKVDAACRVQEKTRLGQVTCKCDNIMAGYAKGDFTEFQESYVLSCAKQKLLAEKVDKKELTESEAEMQYLEWQQQQEALEDQQAAQEEAQRREQELNQAIIHSLKYPQNNSINCTSRAGGSGVVYTNCN